MAVLEKISPEGKLPRRRFRLYWMAAGLLLLALIPTIVILESETGLHTNRWVQFAETKPYPYFPLYPRSHGFPDSNRWNAFLDYNRQDFDSALSKLSSIESDAEVLFYRGVCEYLLGQHEASLTHLREASHLSARWKAPSLWYQANLQLRLGNVKEAGALLEQLSEPGGEYFAEAESLMRQLKLDVSED
jgi:tetratricopeptide (TPR) repeat protein